MEIRLETCSNSRETRDINVKYTLSVALELVSICFVRKLQVGLKAITTTGDIYLCVCVYVCVHFICVHLLLYTSVMGS